MGAEDPRVIVVCGHLCLDVIPGFPGAAHTEGAAPHDYFKPGTLSIVGAPAISTGGAVPNVGISLHRLGLPVRLCAKIGGDLLGTLVKSRLEESLGPEAAGAGAVEGAAEGVAAGVAAVKGEVTSFTVVLNPPGIDRIFLHCPGANDTFTDADVSDSVLSGARIFHFGYPSLMRGMFEDGGERLARLLSRAMGRGAITSLDMSLPDPDSDAGRVDWDAYLSRVLPWTDLFLPNEDEALFMLGGKDAANPAAAQLSRIRELARRILGMGARAVMIKLGGRGAYLLSGSAGLAGIKGWESRELFSPAFGARRVAGTTGAGDAAVAGLLASVYQGLPADASLIMAAAAGACCVEESDATSGVLSWDQTMARIRAGWKRASAPDMEGGWTQRPDGLWSGPVDGKG